MVKWEYHVVVVPPLESYAEESESFFDHLQKLGETGWELVTHTIYGRERDKYIFKRPIEIQINDQSVEPNYLTDIEKQRADKIYFILSESHTKTMTENINALNFCNAYFSQLAAKAMVSKEIKNE